MTQFKAIEVKFHGHVAVVCILLDSLERGRAHDDLLREDLRQLLELVQTVNVIVNFAGVENCSSGALGALIEAQKELAHRSGRLNLCRLNDHLREKLRTLNLEDTVFLIYESESEAIAALQR